MSATERLKEARSRIEAARVEAREVVRGAFKELVEPLFVDEPGLESFGWAQYTPYFNDGDPCVFRGPGDFNINGLGEWGDEEEGEWTPEHSRLEQVVSKVMETFKDDDLEEMFGDHVKVTVKRGREPEVEEYEHD